MPYRNMRTEEQREVARARLIENGATPALADYVIDLGESVHRALRKTLIGMGIFGGIVVLSLIIGWFAFHSLVNDIQDSRAENVKRSCIRDQTSNNVVLRIIDFSLDPANTPPGEPPTPRALIQQFLKLVRPLRPEATLKDCNSTLKRLGTDERLKIEDLLPADELKKRKKEKARRQSAQLRVPEDGRPHRGAIVKGGTGGGTGPSPRNQKPTNGGRGGGGGTDEETPPNGGGGSGGEGGQGGNGGSGGQGGQGGSDGGGHNGGQNTTPPPDEGGPIQDTIKGVDDLLCGLGVLCPQKTPDPNSLVPNLP